MQYFIIVCTIFIAASYVRKKWAEKFHRQLNRFQSLGFELNEGVEERDILRWGNGKVDFEKEPYTLLYQTLGQSLEAAPWTPITNQCWDFDTECIENHGSYVEIFKNLERISKRQLEFDDLEDFVDIENNQAWVKFSISNKSYRWDLAVDDDWVDTNLFSKLSELIKAICPKYGFTYYNTGGQSAVLGFETKKSLKKLKNKTDLDIEWLE